MNLVHCVSIKKSDFKAFILREWDVGAVQMNMKQHHADPFRKSPQYSDGNATQRVNLSPEQEEWTKRKHGDSRMTDDRKFFCFTFLFFFLRGDKTVITVKQKIAISAGAVSRRLFPLIFIFSFFFFFFFFAIIFRWNLSINKSSAMKTRSPTATKTYTTTVRFMPSRRENCFHLRYFALLLYIRHLCSARRLLCFAFSAWLFFLFSVLSWWLETEESHVLMAFENISSLMREAFLCLMHRT